MINGSAIQKRGVLQTHPPCICTLRHAHSQSNISKTHHKNVARFNPPPSNVAHNTLPISGPARVGSLYQVGDVMTKLFQIASEYQSGGFLLRMPLCDFITNVEIAHPVSPSRASIIPSNIQGKNPSAQYLNITAYVTILPAKNTTHLSRCAYTGTNQQTMGNEKRCTYRIETR